MMEHLEGRQSVFAALAARQRKINVILLRHGMHTADLADLLALAESNGVPIRYVDDKELTLMAHGATHGGVLAVATAKPRTSVDQLLERIATAAAPPLLVLLEGIDDDRNLGFAIRTAEACGALALLVKKHMWDFDPVEVSRPSSGAYERLPLVQISNNDDLMRVKKAGIRLIGCLAGAKRKLWEADLTRGVCLAIGGEKRGLSGAVRGMCDRFITIPTVGGASSLSLSHSSAIVMAEALRQRQIPSSAPSRPSFEAVDWHTSPTDEDVAEAPDGGGEDNGVNVDDGDLK
ncbi:MAG TPA: RNA methyltransferase [Tepidisphaeraceae bacterium]|nr:RNA methyltransferase [Tepidisphaeraceae bacterium]